jgi:enoyl-CoA hydratase/carnithine racemase
LIENDAAVEKEIILVSRTPEVLTLRLNRPHRLNALSREMYQRLDELVTTADRDPHLKVIVITGTGRAFSTGGDLKQHIERRRRQEKWDPVEYIRPSNHAFEVLLNTKKVVVAAVNGIAYAAGLIVTLCADIVVCVEESRFCVPEIRTGRAEPWTAGLLSSHVGPQLAAAMVLTGQAIDAQRALAAGLVYKVVPVAQLHEEVSQIVCDVLKAGPEAMAMYKGVLNRYGPRGFDSQALIPIHRSIFSAETLEGTSAFVEKRQPNWVRTWEWPTQWNSGEAE